MQSSHSAIDTVRRALLPSWGFGGCRAAGTPDNLEKPVTVAPHLPPAHTVYGLQFAYRNWQTLGNLKQGAIGKDLEQRLVAPLCFLVAIDINGFQNCLLLARQIICTPLIDQKLSGSKPLSLIVTLEFSLNISADSSKQPSASSSAASLSRSRNRKCVSKLA